MPVRLVSTNPQFFEQARAQAKRALPTQKIPIRGPWAGYMPDIDPYSAPPSACSSVLGLVARPNQSGLGEVLSPDAGFGPVDKDRLPLPISANTGNQADITMLAQFNRTDSSGDRSGNHDKTFMTITAGNNNGSNLGSCQLHRLLSNGQWGDIAFASTNIGSTPGAPPANHEPIAGREFLSDWAEMPAGATSRTGYNDGITEPCLVWCNLQDRVMVYPAGDVDGGIDGDYETLSFDFNQIFKAQTVEAWNGRLYFGNTIENTKHNRQRIRRTALFTADPDPTTPGAGAYDVRDFSGDLLRLEKLGNVMAAYFTDGVAFISATGIATAPDRVELLRDRRGLLSTWAVTPIDDQNHFGVFDDGWFILDPTGRWTEVGMMDIDGVKTRKWKDDFYLNLDVDNRSRLTVAYDGTYVRIAYPKLGDTDNEEVWIYDFRGDRVWKDRYPVTQWGLIDQQVSTATNWDEATGSGTWDTGLDKFGQPFTTFLAAGAEFGLEALSHGTADGHVVTHDYKTVSRWNTATRKQEMPFFSFVSKHNTLGDPTTLKTFMKLWVEYIRTSNDNPVFSLAAQVDNVSGGTQTVPVDFSDGAEGTVQIAYSTFNKTGRQFAFLMSGFAPIEIRSFVVKIMMHESEESALQ